MLSAVFFGSLSSITDLTDIERQAFNRAAADRGLELGWSLGAYRALCLQRGRFQAVRKAQRLMGDADPLPFLQEVEGHMRDLLDEVDLEPSPWFFQSYDFARQKRLKVGLVTGAFQQTTLRVLSNLFRSRASLMFDVVTSAEDGFAHKPNPDLFEHAMEHLNVSPARVLAFETTGDGALAAERAGIYPISIRPAGLAQPGIKGSEGPTLKEAWAQFAKQQVVDRGLATHASGQQAAN